MYYITIVMFSSDTVTINIYDNRKIFQKISFTQQKSQYGAWFSRSLVSVRNLLETGAPRRMAAEHFHRKHVYT